MHAWDKNRNIDYFQRHVLKIPSQALEVSLFFSPGPSAKQIAGFRVFFPMFSFERTRPAASMRPACLIYLTTSNEARLRDRSDRGCLLTLRQKAYSCRGAYRVPLFN